MLQFSPIFSYSVSNVPGKQLPAISELWLCLHLKINFYLLIYLPELQTSLRSVILVSLAQGSGLTLIGYLCHISLILTLHSHISLGSHWALSCYLSHHCDWATSLIGNSLGPFGQFLGPSQRCSLLSLLHSGYFFSSLDKYLTFAAQRVFKPCL